MILYACIIYFREIVNCLSAQLLSNLQCLWCYFAGVVVLIRSVLGIALIQRRLELGPHCDTVKLAPHNCTESVSLFHERSA